MVSSTLQFNIQSAQCVRQTRGFGHCCHFCKTMLCIRDFENAMGCIIVKFGAVRDNDKGTIVLSYIVHYCNKGLPYLKASNVAATESSIKIKLTTTINLMLLMKLSQETDDISNELLLILSTVYQVRLIMERNNIIVRKPTRYSYILNRNVKELASPCIPVKVKEDEAQMLLMIKMTFYVLSVIHSTKKGWPNKKEKRKIE